MERPSSWAAGAGLGMAVAGMLMVNVARGVWPMAWIGVPLLYGLACFGAVPFVEYLLRFTWAAISALGELWAQAQEAAELLPTVTPTTTPDDPAYAGSWQALQDAWYTALRVFFRNGEVAGGFSHSRLVESGSMTDGPWEMLTAFYASDDGARVLRLDSADGYVLGYGWTYDTVRQALVRRALPLPQADPPTLEVLPRDTTRQDGRRRAAEAV